MRSNTWSALLLSALALLAWCGALFLVQTVAALSGGYLFRWTGEEGVSPAALVRVLRYAAEDGAEGAPSASLWQEKPAQTIAADRGERIWTGTVLELFGNGEDVWPAPFLSGGYPVRGDTVGCAVDEAVAQALWGGIHNLGAPVRLNGRTLYVRGVFQGDAGLVLTQGEESSSVPYPNLLLTFPGESTREDAETWLTAGGFTGASALDLPLYQWLLGALCGLPGLLLGVGILLRLVRRGAALWGAPLTLGVYLVPALAVGVFVLWAMGAPPEVPVALIPTRWSDFSFWGELGGRLLDQGRRWLSLPPGRRELAWWLPALGGTVLAVAAGGLTALAAERVRPRGEGVAFLGTLTAGMLIYLCANLFADRGGVVLSRGVWLLPALWLWTGWALDRHGAAIFSKTKKEEDHEANQTALVEKAE